MRSGLSVGDLGDFLEGEVLATLATYGTDGAVRLSPVWFEWLDGGFNVVVGANDVKARHLRRDLRASLTVYENELPYRGVEIRTEVVLRERGAAKVERRLAHRYLGPKRAEAYREAATWDPLLVRLEPGELRVWDFADEWPDPRP